VKEMVKVRNMYTRGGNIAPNQFIIDNYDGSTVFQSYQATVAKKVYQDGEPKVYLYSPYWDFYSATTNRYLLEFLREESIQDVRMLVESGVYEVIE
jgi:hypothetical protein